MNNIDCISPILPCQDSEEIGIVVLRPRHWRGEEFDPLSLFSSDQLKECTLSAVRLPWTTPQEMFREIVLKARPTKTGEKHAPISVLVGFASLYREIRRKDGTQAFNVWASGTPELRSHVDIGIIKYSNSNDPKGNKIMSNQIESVRVLRAKLIDALLGEPACTLPDMWPRLGVCCSGLKSSLISHPVKSRVLNV
ncbi:hypothetical protein [Gluconobacter japonicus]|uniref:hypothetical protein n=1 Tax=Gluconobacter japonicus TaxID=376620 RepID=UPI0039E8BF1E